MKIFDLDSKLWKYGERAFDFILFNCLMLMVSSITLGLGVGVAFSAMVYGMQKSMFANRGGVLSHFIRGVKDSFLQSTIIWLVGLSIIALNGYSFLLMYNTGNMLYVLNAFIIIETLMITIYALTIVSILKMPLKKVLAFAIILPNKHVGITLLMLLSLSVIGYVSYVFGSISFFVSMATVGYLTNVWLINKVLVKYLSEEQKENLSY